MSPQNNQEHTIETYIESQRKAGTNDEQITMKLLQAGWTLQHVNQVLTKDAPVPADPVVNNMTAQSSNAGTPVQIENVQYNMRMKPVQSKVGLYIKIAGTALWFTVVFVASFLTSVVQRIAGNGDDLGTALVLTLSLAVVTTPIFVVAYKKFLLEQRKNPAANDDIFFKQSIRRGLWGAVVLGAIAAIVMLYQFLSAAFLKDSSGSYASGFSALMFVLGFGGLVYFYWRLHSKTQR